MNYIVIDKSFLQRVKDITLSILSGTNKIVITDILLYEITSSEDKTRSKSCLKKLSRIRDSVVFMIHSGTLLKHEIKEMKAAYPFEECLYPKSYYAGFWNIIDNLINDTPIDREEAEQLNKLYFNFYEGTNVQSIKKIGSGSRIGYPQAHGNKQGSVKIASEQIKRSIGENEDTMMNILRHFVLRSGDGLSFNASEYVNQNWIFYRSLQVSQIYNLIYIERYGNNASNVKSTKLPHDSVDLEYCICGLHADRIATGDRLIRDIFLYCKPIDNCIYM